MTVRSEIAAELPTLVFFARKLTQNYHQAEDLAQRTVVRALEAEQLFQEGTKLRAWLFKIELNIFLNDCRKKKNHAERLSRDIEDRPDGASQYHTLLLKEVMEVIAQLPDEQQQAIHLISFEGLQYLEAATFLNIPSGTIKSRVARARNILKERIN